MKTQRNSLRYVAILVLIGCSISLIGISLQTAEACKAANDICEELFEAAHDICKKHGYGSAKCLEAMDDASKACALARKLLCPSS